MILVLLFLRPLIQATGFAVVNRIIYDTTIEFSIAAQHNSIDVVIDLVWMDKFRKTSNFIGTNNGTR